MANLQPPAADDPEALTGALRIAARHADMVFTIGGVSVGERDLVARLGGPITVRAVQVALRPARPFAFGSAFDVPLLAFPGNPASAWRPSKSLGGLPSSPCSASLPSSGRPSEPP